MEQQSNQCILCLKDKHMKAGGICYTFEMQIISPSVFVSCVMYVHSQTLHSYALCDDNLNFFALVCFLRVQFIKTNKH